MEEYSKLLNLKFDKLVQKTKTDPKLKEDVFNTLAQIENIANIVELFTGKFAKSESAVLESMFFKTFNK